MLKHIEHLHLYAASLFKAWKVYSWQWNTTNVCHYSPQLLGVLKNANSQNSNDCPIWHPIQSMLESGVGMALLGIVTAAYHLRELGK